MKVLVTGADGFIGSHLTEALVRAGHEVRAFVLYNSFNSMGWLDRCDSDVDGQFQVFPGDIRDPYGVRTAMSGCDVVLNLAALIGIPYSYHSPQSYVDTNINGALNVVHSARDLGVRHVIQTSTSEVYGSAQFVPITESHPLSGQSPYAASKIGADQIALSYHSSFDTPVTIIRPFNTYGPRQSARAVIPTIIGQIVSGSRALKLGALEPTRDFNFIADTVNGFLLSMLNECSVGQVINLGSNFEISIHDTVQAIADVMGVEVCISLDPERIRPQKSEVDRLWANNDKAKMLLGWEPEYAGIDGFKRGLAQTIDWFKVSDNVSSYKTQKYNI
jgi:NAD dependent epimerase/dehydratase